MDINIGEIIGSNCKFLFMLESPHKTEVSHFLRTKERIPAIGSTGKRMHHALLSNRDSSMGEAIKTNEEQYSQYGILNVSPFPLQECAYLENDLTVPSDNRKELMNQRKPFKNENVGHIEKVEFKKWLLHEANDHFLDSFINRLRRVIVQYPTINDLIVCGNFSQAFFEACFEDVPQHHGGKDWQERITCTVRGREISIWYSTHPINWEDGSSRFIVNNVINENK